MEVHYNLGRIAFLTCLSQLASMWQGDGLSLEWHLGFIETCWEGEGVVPTKPCKSFMN